MLYFSRHRRFCLGIATLGEQLDMDAAEDIRILILLWKLGVGKSSTSETPTSTSSSNSSGGKYGRSGSSGNSKTNNRNSTPAMVLNSNFVPGTIQPAEWKHGCLHLNLHSWESFEAFKPSLDIGFLDQTEFRDFYKFCFRFNLSGTHRTLDVDTVVALLHMILDNTQRVDEDRLLTFCQFLQHPEKGKPYQRITLDQWMSFLDFCSEIPNNTELTSSSKKYDESTSAWPVLIDEYVEFIQNLA
jgi:Cullin binding